MKLKILALLLLSPAIAFTIYFENFPDSISKAKKIYSEEIEQINKNFIEKLETQIKQSAQTGNLELLERLASEKKSFEKDKNKLPSSKEFKSALNDYQKQNKTSKEKMVEAYSSVIKEFTKKLELEKARIIKNEMDFFIRTSTFENDIKPLEKGSEFQPLGEKRNPVKYVFLSELKEDYVKVIHFGFGKGTLNGQPIIYNENLMPHSLTMHPGDGPDGTCYARYKLPKGATKFETEVAIVNSPTDCEIGFEVFCDQRSIWKSKPISRKTQPEKITLDLKNYVNLELRTYPITYASGGYAAWIEPKIFLNQSGQIPNQLPAANLLDFLLTQQNPSPVLKASNPNLIGNWTKNNKFLSSKNNALSIIKIPYPLPKEYDFKVEFFKHTLLGEFILHLIASDKKTDWIIGDSSNTVGFEFVGGNDFKNNVTTKKIQGFSTQKSHISVIKVRKNGITVLLDGKILSQFDYSLFEITPRRVFDSIECLAIGSTAPITILNVQVIPVFYD